MKIVRSSELDWETAMAQGHFQQRRKALGGEAAACGLWELAPGKKSFPMHRHHITEESLFVISGKGHVRTPDTLTPIGPGDFVTFPAGGVAHQLVNDGEVPLVYFALGVGKGVDVVEYPESGKVSASVGTFPPRTRYLFKPDAGLGYFDGEKDAEG